jgi:hypothetical protein
LITEDAIRRGVFKSVAELEAAIAAYLTNHNAASKPFVWTKSADVILRKVEDISPKQLDRANGIKPLARSSQTPLLAG